MPNIQPISFGGIQSVPDYRDIPASAVLGVARYFPPHYKVDTAMLPVWNQRKIGACVGHASGKKKQNQEWDEIHQAIAINPRFIYALAKAEDGLPMEGTYYRLGMKVLQKVGVPPEIPEYTNDTNLSHADYINISKIPQKAYDLAGQYRIKSYASIGSFMKISAEEIMQGIAEGDGILLGVQVGKEWWTGKNGVSSWQPADILPLRAPAAVVSGHAIFADEYEIFGDSRIKIWHTNSWSPEWGERGRGWFWYDEYKNNLVEAWSAIDLPNDWLDIVEQLPNAQTFRHQFNTDLEFSNSNPEVTALQTALMIDGEFSRDLYTRLLKEKQLGYYGQITQQAVRAFQFKYKVASLAELYVVNGRRVGLKSRNKLNLLFAPKS
jgi:hypothetical protein